MHNCKRIKFENNSRLIGDTLEFFSKVVLFVVVNISNECVFLCYDRSRLGEDLE